jgi:hypothetical protein
MILRRRMMLDLKHPTSEEIAKAYKLETFEDAVKLCAHLLWVIKFRDRDIKRLKEERDALSKQLCKEIECREKGLGESNAG